MADHALFEQVRAADLLRFTTAGSVDDGKSTLIGRLLHDSKGLYEDQLAAVEAASRRNGQDDVDLALVTDGLKSEREQRITIDVAYRHFSTPRRRFIIADTPGHEEYTRNMVTGASTADLAIILIDAAHGVLTQSKRHGFIAALLGLPHVVVAVNKMDQVDFDRARFYAIRDEYLAFLDRLGVPEVTCIPLSALHGDNVVTRSERTPWYHGPALLEHLETVPVATSRNLADFRFAVQYVQRPDASFRGYAGTVASGVIHVGDAVAVLPSAGTSRIAAIHGPDGETASAFAGQPATLVLADDLDVGRGHLIAPLDNQPWDATEVAATLIWMDHTPLDPQVTYLVKHTTNLVRGRVTQVEHRIDPNDLAQLPAETLRLNEIGRVHLRLLKPLLCDSYRRNRATGSFILVDPVSHHTVAAGLVEEPLTHRTRTVVSANLTRHTGRITADDRAALLRQQPATIWLTGLSGSGKSTLAYAVEERLVTAGHACVVLDGDNVRHGLNRDLGFSPQDRSENIRRLAEVARLFNDAGLLVVTAFISPYAADRAQARDVIGAERFHETLVDAPVEVCEQRDPKGLYVRARAGQIPEFTGVSAPYERPAAPALRLDTVQFSAAQLVEQVMEHLTARGVLPAGEAGAAGC